MRSAVYMYHLVQSLIKFADNDDAHETYVGESQCQMLINLDFKFHFFLLSVELCKEFLSRVWYAFDGTEERGTEYNTSLDDLLKGYFKNSKFSFINSNAQWILVESKDLNRKNDILRTFPCFKK